MAIKHKIEKSDEHHYKNIELTCYQGERVWDLVPKDRVDIRVKDEVSGMVGHIDIMLGSANIKIDKKGNWIIGAIPNIYISVSSSMSHRFHFNNFDQLLNALSDSVSLAHVKNTLSEIDIDKLTLEEAKEYLKKIKSISESKNLGNK